MSSRESIYTKRAVYLGSEGVSIAQRKKKQEAKKLPPIPAKIFLSEKKKAFYPTTPSSVIALDASKELGLQFKATSPSILASYLTIRPGEKLITQFKASIEYYFVIQGNGYSEWGGEQIEWHTGDLFFLPGGYDVTHHAANLDAVLYVLTDEPLLNFLCLQSPEKQGARFSAVHYTAKNISSRQNEVYSTSGSSGVINFGVEEQIAFSSIVPTWKWIKPGENQIPHKHSPVAIQLFISGDRCYSKVGNQRIDWSPFTVAISPPGSLHSHHNEGNGLGIYLVTQDLPMQKYLRTYWYDEPETGTYFCDW